MKLQVTQKVLKYENNIFSIDWITNLIYFHITKWLEVYSIGQINFCF